VTSFISFFSVVGLAHATKNASPSHYFSSSPQTR
jgi:hypothetical protein